MEANAASFAFPTVPKVPRIENTEWTVVENFIENGEHEPSVRFFHELWSLPGSQCTRGQSSEGDGQTVIAELQEKLDRKSKRQLSSQAQMLIVFFRISLCWKINIVVITTLHINPPSPKKHWVPKSFKLILDEKTLSISIQISLHDSCAEITFPTCKWTQSPTKNKHKIISGSVLPSRPLAKKP